MQTDTLISLVIQRVTEAEKEKPLKASTLEIAVNALMEKVEFIAQPGNSSFYSMYRQPCIDLTMRVDSLASALKPNSPNEENAKIRITKTISSVKNLLKMEDSTLSEVPKKPASAASVAYPANSVTIHRPDRACPQNLCQIVGVAAVVITGIVIPLFMNKSIL